MRKKINLCVSVPENGVELLEILCRSAVSLASGLNEISLNFPLRVNDGVVLNPRNYDGAVFEMSSGTDNFTSKTHSMVELL